MLSDTDICIFMKTTLNFDDQLIKLAKERALKESDTLTGIIEKALRQFLFPPKKKPDKKFTLKLLTKKGSKVKNFSLEDRDSLYEAMDS